MLLRNIFDDKLYSTPLLVKGYSNLRIFKDKKEFLLKVGLEDVNTNELFATNYLQPEFLSLFPLKSVIYKGKIEKFEGFIKEIILNFSEVKYKKFKDIDNSNLKELINDIFYFNDETYFAKYKNIVFPSLIIGQYFYFPNTNVRRLFRKEHIDALAYEIDCNNGHIIFKRNIKNEDITAIFAYLFECNKYFADAFKNAFIKNINEPLEKKYELYSPTLFKFPKKDKELKLLVRGEMFNNVFIVYEILNFDFRQIIPLDKLEVSYLGKKQIKSLKTNKIASKVPLNKSNISQTASYSKEYTETIFESSEFIINDLNQIKVEKVNPVKFNETFSKKEVYKKNVDNQGITFGNNQDNNSGFGSAGLAIDKGSFKLLEEFIKKTFNVSFYESGNKPDYAYIHFILVFRDGSYREYLILKLNRPNTAWYIFSSFNKLPRIFAIINELLKIKDGNSKFKNNNHYASYLLKKMGVCFHKSLKAKEKSGDINHWFQRFKKRILDYDKCKGIK